MKTLIIIFLSLFIITGCATKETNSSYGANEIGQSATVEKGTILDMREVNIKKESGVGTAAGAGIGGVAGSAVGGGARANILGAIAGAVIGGIAGNAVDKKANSSKAYEFIIEKENNQTISIVQTNENNLSVGDNILIIRGQNTRLTKQK